MPGDAFTMIGWARPCSHTVSGGNWQPKRSKGGPMMRFVSLGLFVAVGLLVSGCFSFSSTTRKETVPAPAPEPVVQRTVYPDGTYVDRIVQP
jgi:hypothetical protein